MWMHGQMRPQAPCVAIVLAAYSLYIGMVCRYLPLHHRTWLQHYDGNSPLLVNLIDAGAMNKKKMT